MKLSKVILTVLALMTISSSALAYSTYSTPQNEEYCKYKMEQWTKMCEQNDYQTAAKQAYQFYIESDMHIAYYDEWVNVDFEGRRMSKVGTPSKILDIWNKGNN